MYFVHMVIEYPFKYVCKVHNRITVELIVNSGNQKHNEIRYFQNALYVSALEALWRPYWFYILDLKSFSRSFRRAP